MSSKSFKLSVLLVALLVFDTPKSFSQEQASDHRAPASTERNHETKPAPAPPAAPAGQRIIDRRDINTESSLPARVVLAPFRFLAPHVNSGLTRLENQQEMNRLALLLSNPSILHLQENLPTNRC